MTTVLNDLDMRVTVLCSSCGPEGHLLNPQQRVTFDRVSGVVTFRRGDGTETCVLFGRPAGDQSQTPPAGGSGSESQPIRVSSGGNC